MTSAADAMAIACAEVGYDRYKDPQAGSKYGRWYAARTGQSYYAQSGVPYCAMFVSWVLAQAGVSCPGVPGAYCPTMHATGKATRGVAKSELRFGDVVFFDWGRDGVDDHVGFVLQARSNDVLTVEGNTSNGKVAKRSRAYSSITGGIRPYYNVSKPEEEALSQAEVDQIKSYIDARTNEVLTAIGALPRKTWGYRNEDLEPGKDAYQILRDTRDGVKDAPHDTWNYRNPDLEQGDAYQILRDVRDAVVPGEHAATD